jgi:hypothetical protein
MSWNFELNVVGNLFGLVPLQSKFFPAKFFFCILETEILAGKSLLGKRVKLLCKESFSI